MTGEPKQKLDAAAHITRMQNALEGQPQWVFPQVFLYTPSTTFSFPDYPGLSVGLRYYIIVGKVAWCISVALLLLTNLIYGVFTLGLGLLITVPVSIVCLLFLNLSLALQFASCELIAVIIKMEGHLAYISGRRKNAKQKSN